MMDLLPQNSWKMMKMLRRRIQWMERGFSTFKDRQDLKDHESYDALLHRLYQVNMFNAAKLGLQNMLQLQKRMLTNDKKDDLEKGAQDAVTFDIVHVAGTNGKGSVAWKIAKALEVSGYRTGLFVSPHISCFRERIQINGEWISEDDVVVHLRRLFDLAEQFAIPATFFELTTALALSYYAEQHVDAVVLEAGLGGRLDSTNVVQPTVSVITSVGLDHTRILGNTIEAIAREKAGIIKHATPVVIGPNAPVTLLKKHARAMNAPVSVVPASVETEDYDIENTRIAEETVHVLNDLYQKSASRVLLKMEDAKVQQALASRPPCRFEEITVEFEANLVNVVLDVAHNPMGIDKLVDKLLDSYPERKFQFVCGFSADKDIKYFVAKLLQIRGVEASDIHFVQGTHPRCASMMEIFNALDETSKTALKDAFVIQMDTVNHRYPTHSISDGVKKALERSKSRKEKDLIVVCGSVFIMAEAQRALGKLDGLQDSYANQRMLGSHLKTSLDRLSEAETIKDAASGE